MSELGDEVGLVSGSDEEKEHKDELDEETEICWFIYSLYIRGRYLEGVRELYTYLDAHTYYIWYKE